MSSIIRTSSHVTSKIKLSCDFICNLSSSFIVFDHNIPLITNARLASAFIDAFCNMNVEDIQIKSWQEYK